MDNLSDLCHGELDSLTSTDSLQLISDEFHLRHLSTPDVSNIELSKRVALLELENERLRINLENMQIDLNARIAANQGLKSKITELFMEMQAMQQEEQKLRNILTDTSSRLSAAEASAKWYQSQMHILMASKKNLQVEIDTYQRILKQRQRMIADVNASYKQLNVDYAELAQRYQKEKRDMQNAIKEAMQLHVPSIDAVQNAFNTKPLNDSTMDLSMVLEATEDELRNTKTELKMLEQQLLGNELTKMSIENTLTKQRILISSMEENIQKCETEKNETADLLRKTQLEIQKLRVQNESLQTSLLDSKQGQSQVEDAISHLRIQLSKMIAHYKLLKSKNAESQEKLSTMQDLINENKRLKTLSHKANSTLLKKLREGKAKIRSLEQRLYNERTNGQVNNMKNTMEHSSQRCLTHVLSRNKKYDVLQDQLKLVTRVADENIDEGYGDSSFNISSISLDIPSPSSANSVLLSNAADVLARSKNFCLPMQEELNVLKTKIEKLHNQRGALNQQKDFHFSFNKIIALRDSI